MHLCLDADRILLQYEILEGHTQLTHLHFMLPPFCRLSLCLWGSAHINFNLDGASRWVRAFANQKREKNFLQSSEVSQDNKTIGLMGQACYQAVSGNQSWKREGLVLSENIWFAEKWIGFIRPIHVQKPSIKSQWSRPLSLTLSWISFFFPAQKEGRLHPRHMGSFASFKELVFEPLKRRA